MSRKIDNLGRSLIRDHKKKRGIVKDGFRHTSDLPDGLDWARLNLRSVTEQSSIDDFLDQAQLAQTEYSKEFSNVEIVNPDTVTGFLTEKEEELMNVAHETHKHILSVPRRPHWDASTTKEELDVMEQTEFLNWRRKLAMLNEEKYLKLTPYEKNLEVWRQLWRVIERSEVIVQIIDARNPLLFRCEDLEFYVKELDPEKQNILLLNKADFLSEKQRNFWAQYFENIGVTIIFFSALQQSQPLSEIAENEVKEDSSEADSVSVNSQASVDQLEKSENVDNHDLDKSDEGHIVHNSSKIYTREELILFFKQIRKPMGDNDFVTIGLVGYPNVGKSSTINSLIQDKKVQVSATPGKTKHFQTLMVDSELCLCDCPGLVFPNFMSSKAEMIINGILPIDRLTDHVAPMTLIAKLIPKAVLESTYSIIIKSQSEGNSSETPTAEELLDAYGYMRGYMTKRGLPDHSRSSRYILKDFVNGRLLYCHAPPGMDKEEYAKYTIRQIKSRQSTAITSSLKTAKVCSTMSEEIDKNFFQKTTGQAHVKGVKPIIGSMSSTNDLGPNKPWKKHYNKNKKEKLRRVYSASDY